MEIESGYNRPFVIRRNQNRTLIPVESSVFDEKVENYVSFVQGANAFVAVFEIYDSFRVFYKHFAYSDTCGTFSHYMIALGVLNLIWIIASIAGIVAINSRQSSKIAKYFYFLFLYLILRTAFYVIMEINMNDVLGEQECDFIYQGGLYIINAILEGVLILTLIILTAIIKRYVQTWENTQHNMHESAYTGI